MLDTSTTAFVCGELVWMLYIFITNRARIYIATSSKSMRARRIALCCWTRYFNSNTLILFREHMYVQMRECTLCTALSWISVDCKMVSILSSMFGFKDTGWRTRLLTLNHSWRDIQTNKTYSRLGLRCVCIILRAVYLQYYKDIPFITC